MLKSEKISQSQIDTLIYLTLMWFTVWVAFFNLNDGISAWDEIVYAATAKYSLAKGLWLFPAAEIGGRVDKPSFYLWLIMASYKIFGVHEWSTRIPAACGVVMSVHYLYRITKQLFSSPCHIFATFLLAASPFFLKDARCSLLDTLMIGFQLGFVWYWLRARDHSKSFIVAMLFLGLAFALKQLLALSILIPIFTTRWKQSEFRPLPTRRDWWIGIGLFLVVGCTWYLIITWKDPAFGLWLMFERNFAERFVYSENITPAFWLSTIGAHHFYFHPLESVGVLAVLLSLRWVFWERTPGKVFFSSWLLLHLAALSTISFPATQYILGIFPALCLVIGELLEKFWKNEDSVVDRMIGAWLFGTALFALVSTLNDASISPSLPITIAIVAGLVFTFASHLRGVISTFVGRCFVVVVLAATFHPPLPKFVGWGMRDLLAKVDAYPNVPIYGLQIAHYWTLWYHGIDAKPLSPYPGFQTVLLPPGPGLLLAWYQYVPLIQAEAKEELGTEIKYVLLKYKGPPTEKLFMPDRDSDGDGIMDAKDNCVLVSNPNQLDTDDDGFGNRCDLDLNQDLIVDTQDLWLAYKKLSRAGSELDFDDSGRTNRADFQLFVDYYRLPPGPSGLHPELSPFGHPQ